jgi:hypothetical protein
MLHAVFRQPAFDIAFPPDRFDRRTLNDDHHKNNRKAAPSRADVGFRARAFSSEMGTGSREEMRQNKNLELRFCFNQNRKCSRQAYFAFS